MFYIFDKIKLNFYWLCGYSLRKWIWLFGIIDLVLTVILGSLSIVSFVYVFMVHVRSSLEVKEKAERSAVANPPIYIELLTNSVVGNALIYGLVVSSILIAFFLVELYLVYLLRKSIKKENRDKFSTWLALRLILLVFQTFFAISWLMCANEVLGHPLTYTVLFGIMYRVGELLVGEDYLEDIPPNEQEKDAVVEIAASPA